MDPVCHSLAGLTMGQAGLRRRTPLALPTLVLAANAPDIDVVTMATDRRVDVLPARLDARAAGHGRAAARAHRR